MKSTQSRRSRGSRQRPTMAFGTSGGRNCRAASPRSLGRTSDRPPDRRSLGLQSSRFLFACPFRCSFVEEGHDTLARVGRRDEFIEINLLRPGQAFVKVKRIPRVDGLLGVSQRGRAQLAEFGKRPLDDGFEFLVGHGSICQAHRGGFYSRKLTSRKDQFRGALLTDERGQRHGGDRRIAGQLDFGKSPTGIVRGVNRIADGGKFRASAETTPRTAAMVTLREATIARITA